MPPALEYLEGRKFCVVFVKVVEPSSDKVQMQCLHGRASVEQGKLHCITSGGVSFTVPNSALSNILPNDGTAMLRDAEYFVFVKTDPGVEFIQNGGAGEVYDA